MKPHLKSLTCLAGDGELLVSLDPRTRVGLADPSGQVLALLHLLREGTRTPGQVHIALAADWPDITEQDVLEAIELLDGFGWLEDAAATTPLTAYQRERYSSNLAFFDAFTTLDTSRESFQRQLLDPHVVLLGAGGLGSSVLQNLAGFGVGAVTLVDFDRVELKNLARQFTYSEAQVGTSKVQQVAAWVRSFDSHMSVRAIEMRVTSVDDIRPLLHGADLLISAIDQPDNIDLTVNEACMHAGVPFIRGGLAYMQGVYWSVAPGRSACRACLEAHRQRGARTIDRAVVEGPPCSARIGPIARPAQSPRCFGGLVALEAVRYLTGFVAPVSTGTYQLVDFASNGAISTDAWPPDPQCALCAAAGARRGLSHATDQAAA